MGDNYILQDLKQILSLHLLVAGWTMITIYLHVLSSVRDKNNLEVSTTAKRDEKTVIKHLL